jgi:[protein-PII] uridylyltransferase
MGSPEPGQSTQLQQRARLNALRDEAHKRYAGGAPVLQVAALICEMTDRLIIDLFQQQIAALDEPSRKQTIEHSALVAIGGSGRGELAPYSDADLLFLCEGRFPRGYEEAVRRTERACWDAGIRLASRAYTPRAVLADAAADPQLATALIEARLLWGSQRLLETLLARFRRRVARDRSDTYLRAWLAAREAERLQYGSSERQLEPDVKRSPGGLRDIHLVRWIGFAVCGTPDLDLMRRALAISHDDAQALSAAQEFLTRVRVDLHFGAGKPQETLSREEQLRLAELHGIKGRAGQRPVERFMQIYFEHATAVADVAERFVVRHHPRRLWSRIHRSLVSHRSNEIFRVGRGEIDVPPRHIQKLLADPERLFQLYELAGLYGARVAPALSNRIREAKESVPADLPRAARKRFLALLGTGRNLGALLRDMHRNGLLERALPEFARVRCLMQFNQYHTFTVDEHTLRAVEAAQGFAGDSGVLGTAFRAIKHKEVLFLALLLHDAGKGEAADHCEVGLRLARGAVERLELPRPQAEAVTFLVHQHLAMTHLAFRRDLTDSALLARFSRDVGSPELLGLLFVHSAADLAAVGPGNFTNWKAELLAELYSSAMAILAGVAPRFRETEQIEQIRRLVRAAARELAQRGGPAAKKAEAAPHGTMAEEARVEAELETFPLHYLATTDPQRIVLDLHLVRQLESRDALAQGTYDEPTGTVDYRVVTRDRVGSGLFSKICGALTAQGMSILSATICTSSTGVVIDSFRVIDEDYRGRIPDDRLRHVERLLIEAVTGARQVEELFKRRISAGTTPRPGLREPSRVVIDNDTSDRFTIIDVFAHDQRGLLYAIAKALFDLRLSVSVAKIATTADQVLDVFYVTDREGSKIVDEVRIGQIRATLLERIEALASAPN